MVPRQEAASSHQKATEFHSKRWSKKFSQKDVKGGPRGVQYILHVVHYICVSVFLLINVLSSDDLQTSDRGTCKLFIQMYPGHESWGFVLRAVPAGRPVGCDSGLVTTLCCSLRLNVRMSSQGLLHKPSLLCPFHFSLEGLILNIMWGEGPTVWEALAGWLAGKNTTLVCLFSSPV